MGRWVAWSPYFDDKGCSKFSVHHLLHSLQCYGDLANRLRQVTRHSRRSQRGKTMLHTQALTNTYTPAPASPTLVPLVAQLSVIAVACTGIYKGWDFSQGRNV